MKRGFKGARHPTRRADETADQAANEAADEVANEAADKAANQATEAANQGASEAARGAADEVSGMGHPGTDTPCAPARLQTIHVGRLMASWMKQIREIRCPLQTAVKGSTAAENLTGESFFGYRFAMCHE